MNRAWLWVIAGGLLETGWASTMKMSEGFTDIPYTILTIALLIASTVLLNKGLKAGIPTGPCYAVWVGIGAMGATLVGVLFFGEMLSLMGWACMLLLGIGIIGLNAVTE